MAVSCEPSDLVAASVCLGCLTRPQLDAVSVYSLCYLANNWQVGPVGFIAGEGTGEAILGEGGEQIGEQ